MSLEPTQIDQLAEREAAARLQEAAAAAKCRPCGCLHGSLAAIEDGIAVAARPPELAAALHATRERLEPVRYECLGCAICYPALAINALEQAAGADLAAVCPPDSAAPRAGWPPLPGTYTVLRYRAPVAVCTLTDDTLAGTIVQAAGPAIAIVGTLQTENLGIERLICNLLANPWIRCLVLAGEDSRRAIGHLPGQAVVSLMQKGLDDRGRIVGATGKRPVLRNIGREAVEHFRRTVTVIDRIGATAPAVILEAAQDCAASEPGPASPYALERTVQPRRGHVPARLVPDPAGYFVLYADRTRRVLALEHYGKDGVLDTILEGNTAAELYTPAIEQGLLSRLDHAAYLGRELARAEHALTSGEPYVQDAAPERVLAAGGGCGSSCTDEETS
jgi:tetrahydromethanopterin S-methyltransferase subunit A